MQPWCPFALTDRKSPNFSQGHTAPIGAVVVHIAQGGATGSVDWLTNPKSKVSSHFFITKTGVIRQLVSLHDTAWCNGLIWRNGRWLTPKEKPVTPRWKGLIPGKNPNGYTISIEHEGNSGDVLTPSMVEAQTKLLTWLCSQLEWAWLTPGVNFIGHGDINPVDKPFCPGKAFDLQKIADRIGGSGHTQPAGALLTEDTPIISPPRATQAQCVNYILSRPHKNYGQYDIQDVIIPTYFAVCEPVGIDPLVAIAQMIHETGNLCSALSARQDKDKRDLRNPAGIGVWEARDKATPYHRPGTVWDADVGGYRPACQFQTWTAHAIPAHVGRLLAYAVPAAQWTDDQKALVVQALEYRILPTKLWGSAPTLKQLGKAHNPAGDGWASPGDKYGAAIAQIMNAVRGQ